VQANLKSAKTLGLERTPSDATGVHSSENIVTTIRSDCAKSLRPKGRATFPSRKSPRPELHARDRKTPQIEAIQMKWFAVGRLDCEPGDADDLHAVHQRRRVRSGDLKSRLYQQRAASKTDDVKNPQASTPEVPRRLNGEVSAVQNNNRQIEFKAQSSSWEE
jgi:hypothetical protein